MDVLQGNSCVFSMSREVLFGAIWASFGPSENQIFFFRALFKKEKAFAESQIKKKPIRGVGLGGFWGLWSLEMEPWRP